MRPRRPLLLALLSTLLWGCESNASGDVTPPLADPATQPAPAETPQAQPAADTLDAALVDPSRATEQAPAEYTVTLHTTAGDIAIHVTRSWAPHGADRFYNLVKVGYFQDLAFFRVIAGFMAQTGIHGNPQVAMAWRQATISDDPVVKSNKRGMVTFAKTNRPDSRSTQIFINFKNNANLDAMGFAPFGEVSSMKAVDALYSGYGEGAPRGQGPEQFRIIQEGNTYLRAAFPELDYIKTATIEEG